MRGITSARYVVLELHPETHQLSLDVDFDLDGTLLKVEVLIDRFHPQRPSLIQIARQLYVDEEIGRSLHRQQPEKLVFLRNLVPPSWFPVRDLDYRLIRRAYRSKEPVAAT